MTNGTLRAALDHEGVAGSLPAILPLAHLTVNRWLDTMLGNQKLIPRTCSVFAKDLLYFSYGGLFYRPKRLQTEKATELPIGLVFSPKLLDAMASVYPFDTGAMESNAQFASWKAQFDPYKTRFVATKSDAPLLVRLLYHENGLYLQGRVTDAAKTLTEPLRLLASFLGDDMTPQVDHRQRTIECLADTPVPLGEHLEWIGFPNVDTTNVLRKIYACTQPHLPDYYAYSYTKNFNPAEIAARLEEKANETAIRKYVEL